MWERIDFEKEVPFFDNGLLKWYKDKYFENYIPSQQSYNLPPLKNMGCFVVKGNDIEDYVLIDNQQNVIAAYRYTYVGLEQMEAMINILKVKQNYEEYEKVNI